MDDTSSSVTSAFGLHIRTEIKLTFEDRSRPEITSSLKTSLGSTDRTSIEVARRLILLHTLTLIHIYTYIAYCTKNLIALL